MESAQEEDIAEENSKCINFKYFIVPLHLFSFKVPLEYVRPPVDVFQSYVGLFR